uniref:multidrug resistance-associated protein 4-like isoform X2 n=1 Tax=Styela clava TaxID=7725 RepID=UPI00193A7EA3|nr:multidrug resistance-associated protein 4-like isoform X2 [Styela clava]
MTLKPNTMKKSNIFSYITFWWLNDLFAEGRNRTLQEADMYELDPSDRSEEICNKLEKHWESEKEKPGKTGKPSLLRAITKTYGNKFMVLGTLGLFTEILRMAIPIFIIQLIRYFENKDTSPTWHGYAYAAAITFSSIILPLVYHLYFYQMQRIGWHIRASTCALMYKKTLRLSRRSLQQTSTGQIINLGSSDVARFDFLPIFLHYLWMGPLECIAVWYILWQEVGMALLAGIGVFLLITITQISIGRQFGKLRSATAVLTDKRIRLTNEVITGIRTIKMHAWEEPFAKLVEDARRTEVMKIIQSSSMKAFNSCIYFCQEKLTTFAILLTFVAMGGTITASKVFSIVGLLNALRLSTGMFISLAIEHTFSSIVSCKRIQKYLILEEYDTEQNKDANESSCQPFVKLQNFSAMWETDKPHRKKTLQYISADIKNGELIAVIGSVGSGKSSLLSALTGELSALDGTKKIKGKISYVDQLPWIFSGTIRENILFGSEYDSKWYTQVITACSLSQDLNVLKDGDLTPVGERGLTLSGGQKARVALARAVYRKDADIFLMDDTLSSVDTAVANHIFHHCINGLLLKKIRILVTNQMSFLKDCGRIMALKEGRVVGFGSYEELLDSGFDLVTFLNKNDEANKTDQSFRLESDTRQSAYYIDKLKTATSTESTTSNEYLSVGNKEEVRAQGSVKRRVYLNYFRLGANTIFMVTMIIVSLASHVLYIMNDWWLAEWSQGFENHIKKSSNSNSLPKPTELFTLEEDGSGSSVISNRTIFSANTIDEKSTEFDTKFYRNIYIIITVSMFIIILLRANMHFYFCISSGIRMHAKMFNAILKSPSRFFDINPAGGILNRFSKDMCEIDEFLPPRFWDFLFITGFIVSVIILTAVTNYFVVFIVIPLGAYFVWLRKYYLHTSRDIKRLEGTTRSPIFCHLSSTLQGLPTVRAFRVEKQFKEKYHQNQNLHSASWFLFLTSSHWFGLRLDLITAIFISAVAFLCVVCASLLNLTPGEVGLILTFSAGMVTLLQWGVRQSAEVENLMTSVERIQQYYRLPSEAASEIEATKPPADWPFCGRIQFNKVSFSYFKNGPNVLKEVCLRIKPNEKIGVVGRTGAGKTSLVAALFRLNELENGEIYIDGIPISTLGLKDLRVAISVIPQDPILFAGTMRRNIDPFDIYTDDKLWEALAKVQLADFVKSLSLQLNTEMAETGSNFSVGQRQLICFARAILAKTKILVGLIDEATANVDMRTDQLIQSTIREEFKHSTVITIAHRINTVIDSDRILVLGGGLVKEFDEPYKLLQNKNGHFANIIKTIGCQEAKILESEAKRIYDKKYLLDNHT